MKIPGFIIWVAMILTAMIGCSGKMDGVVRRDAKRIEIIFTDSRISAAELVTVMPDGERFSGKPERFDKVKDMMEKDSTNSDDISVHFENLQTFAGNVKATLSGNRGGIIKCRFNLTDVIIGFSSGGTGMCQVADGREIDVFF